MTRSATIDRISLWFFALAVLMPLDGSFLRACMYLAFAQAIVGAIGFLLHICGISGGVSSLLSENILFGPPLFAPLLFSNLAVLVGIGLYARISQMECS